MSPASTESVPREDPRLARGLAALALLAAALWVLLPREVVLDRPRLGIPAVLRPGETFDVHLRDGLPFALPTLGESPRLGARLVGQQRAAELELVELERCGPRVQATLRVPQGLPSGAFDLNLTYAGVELQRVRSVHLWDGPPEEWKIVQLADLPRFSTGQNGDESGDRRMAAIVEEINLIHPDLVMLTGDVAYGGSWEQYRRLHRALELVAAPVVAVLGNHEYQGLSGYLTLFGAPYHTVDLGDLRIVSLNSSHGRDQFTASQFRFLQRALEERAGREVIVQLHHPLHWKNRVRNRVRGFIRAVAAARVPLVLSGHWHGDHVFDETGAFRNDTWDFAGTRFVVTTAAGADLREEYSASPLHHGYRLIRMRSGRLVNYTYDWDGNGVRHSSASIPVDGLHVERTGPGAVRVANELNEDFQDARVELAWPGRRADLEVNQGRIERVWPTPVETRYAVLFDLPARTAVELRLEERE